jgi:Leucine Rich Repeat (LRR) protein/integrase family protein with SAM-like domain
MTKASSPTLSCLVQNFICQRLQAQQQVSPHTLASYRDPLRLLLAFVEQKTARPPAQQTLRDWNGPTILDFLDHLEKQRGCQARTRNVRLAALRAFMRYVSQHSVTIPNRVISIGTCAFAFCTSLRAITVDASNPVYCTVDGVLFNKNQTTLVQCAAGKAASYLIPNSVTTIALYAFVGCSSLTNITIPNSVTSIEDGAFCYCTILTSITIPSSVTSISQTTFAMCYDLSSVSIPNSITSIGDLAFEDCTSLTSVTIPNSVNSIGDWAFDNCSGLTSVTILNSVTNIGDYASFYGCSNLTSVAIPSSVTSIGDMEFHNCSSLTSVAAPQKSHQHRVGGVLRLRQPDGGLFPG